MSHSDKIAQIRKEYTLQSLDAKDVNKNPFQQFQKWFEEVLQAKIPEANAMHLATVSEKGYPSARIVLLKGLDKDGFIFYTNYESQKGKEMAQNPFVCLTFFWAELERQVRIEGKVSKTDEETALNYFHSRPRESQLGACVSPQSQIIESREFLENRYRLLAEEHEGKVIPKPQHWGGYKVLPFKIEFWQGRPSRLHDRIVYQKNETGNWEILRLAP